MPGAWVWGVTPAAMRSSFARRNEGSNYQPKMSQEDAIPEEFLRMEIVLDVKYSSRVSVHTEEIDKARVTEVEEAYVKFQGLGYDEVVWEHPPSPSESERWNDFVAAYNEYIAGKYFKQPHPKLKEHIQEYRAIDFNKKILQQDQPAFLTGGKMMEYQIEGLNWLLYNYHQGKNVVLADEMGLGKTIQVIAAIATLVKGKPKVCLHHA
jgi:SNF2 family DNA or RNA helicase